MLRSSKIPDIFVAGGGPAGLAAAIAARQRGFDVLVTDPCPPPIGKACGEGIMPDGLAAARALGLDLGAAGQPFRGIRFVAAGNDRPANAAADFPKGCGIGLRRTALHRILLERAAEAGVRMAWGERVAGLEDVRARWIVGADGASSLVRRWAGLDASHRDTRRYGFRRHYHVAPWGEHMEIHWADNCQLYITPVAADEICAVLISRDPRLRLDDALPRFPEVASRLGRAGHDRERGSVTATRRLKSVCRGRVALIGDASGSVDAITGQGLCLLFQQAVALAGALDAGDLARYQREHRRIGRRPELMADLMLMLDGRRRLRRFALSAVDSYPSLFRRLLALHVGEPLWSIG
jgi:flavin-dependent dehydrogenase